MDNFLLKLKSLSQNKETLKIDALLREKIKQEPNNIDWLLRLAIIEIDPPFADEFTCLELIEKALALDPNNITATLLLAYINHYCFGGIKNEHLQKILSIKTNNNEEKSMLSYVASWFYRDHNDPEGEKNCLLESIKFCNKHVWNHKDLARLFLAENQTAEAKSHLQQALHNIIKVYSETFDNYDETDVDEFINDRIKGIYQMQSTVERLQKELNQIQD